MAGVSPESSGSSYTPETGRQTLKNFFNEKTPEDIQRYLDRHYGNVDDVKWVLKEAAKAGDEITIDTSIGGLGGCPFAGPGAKGNTATEDLVYALGADGFESEIDLDGLVATSWWLSSMTQHPPRSLVAHARK
jgi:hypothetical protein